MTIATQKIKMEFDYSSGMKIPAATVLRALVSDSHDPAVLKSSFGGPDLFDLLLKDVERRDAALPGIVQHVFSRIPGESGQEAAGRLVALTRIWDAGHRPSLPAIVLARLDQMGLDATLPLSKTLILAAARAEKVSEASDGEEPVYHNRVHTMQVFQSVCYLLMAHRELSAKASATKDQLLQVALTPFEELILMIAAVSHDVDHNGKGNPKEQAYYNEDISTACIFPFVSVLTNDNGIFGAIRDLVRFTDPAAPREQLKKIIDDFRAEKPDASRTPAFWVQAAMLADSDLLFSCGAGPEAMAVNSTKLTKEVQKAGINIDFTTAASSKIFMDKIVGPEGFLSGSARAVFNPVYIQLRHSLAL